MLLFTACKKNNDTNSGGGNPSPSPTATTCIFSGIFQVNKDGVKPESALTVYYDNSFNVTRILIYDSVYNIKRFDANFNYITNDSIRIDGFQYLKLDAQKRVVLFVTKSDLKDPANADTYIFEYVYNSQGYLDTKNLYVNGSKLPNFKTVYTYTNNLITKCVMTAVSSGNLKVLESDLIYNSSINIKTWIYTFPDAFEGYMYYTALNFGNRPTKPLQQVITKIYSAAGALLDTWATNYSSYKVDSNGYITFGVANGDLQQGIGAFYGKTNFYYQCH